MEHGCTLCGGRRSKHFVLESGDVWPHPTSDAPTVNDAGISTSDAAVAFCAVNAVVGETDAAFDVALTLVTAEDLGRKAMAFATSGGQVVLLLQILTC